MDLVNKYRPTRLSEVVGQTEAVTILRGMLKAPDDIGPVTLFCGPHSTGKTTLAWLLALYSNCKSPKDGEACRKCSSCKNTIQAIRTGRDGRSVIEKPVSDRGIETIRRLESEARLRCSDRYRWYVIDEVHNLTKPAFDAALRLFEKPPKQARFVLCTTEAHKVPLTIRSRARIFNLKPIAPEVTARYLLYPVCQKEGFGLGKEALISIAKTVNGHPRDALNLLDQAAAALASGVTPNDLPRIMPSMEAAAPYKAIQDYVSYVLRGNAGRAIYSARAASSAEYFIGQTITLLREVLHRWIKADVMADPKWDYAIHAISPPEGNPQRLFGMARVLDLCVEAQDRIKQHRVDEAAVLEILALDIATITARWFRKE